MSKTLIENVEYGHSLGWSFTPLTGKRPTLRAWQKRKRETAEQAVTWAKAGNVGLRTGKTSGVVVIDVDAGGDISGLDLPGTVTVNTGRTGIHLYYRCSKTIPNSAGKLGSHIDVRGDGGQVVYPGSIHPETAKRYEWADGYEPWNVELAELPAKIVKILQGTGKKAGSTSSQAPGRTNAGRETRYASAAVKCELDAILAAGEGQRNHTLNAAAFNLGQLVGGGYIEREAIESELTAAAVAAGLQASEISATIRSGLNSGAKQPRRISARSSNATATMRRPGDRGDYILVPGAHTDDAGKYIEVGAGDFCRDVLDSLPQEQLYRREHMAGELMGEPGGQRWLRFTGGRMLLAVDDHMRLGKWRMSKKDDDQVITYQPCRMDWAKTVIEHARGSSRVRELKLLVNYPIYGPGWKRVEAGWHNGYYYDEPPALEGIGCEKRQDVIRNVLMDLIVDFPFKGEADKQNFLGLLLTPIIAPALQDNRPLHMIVSSLERTGKTKLAEDVLGGIIQGEPTPAMQLTDREDERDKRIMGLLLSGETILHLDNLAPYLDSGSLSSLLTTPTYKGRLLGGNEMPALRNDMTIVATGNNVLASGELLKRTVPIVLQPATASPESRRDFHHPDLRAFVKAQRRIVIECLIGLVVNWIEAGKPMHANRLGSFESWSQAVGGILQVNGLKAWRTNEKTWRQRSDPKGQEIRAFVTVWKQTFGLGEINASDLRELASREELFGTVFSKRGERAISVAFGRMMRSYADTPVGEYVIRYENRGNHPAYRLEPIL